MGIVRAPSSGETGFFSVAPHDRVVGPWGPEAAAVGDRKGGPQRARAHTRRRQWRTGVGIGDPARSSSHADG